MIYTPRCGTISIRFLELSGHVPGIQSEQSFPRLRQKPPTPQVLLKGGALVNHAERLNGRSASGGRRRMPKMRVEALRDSKKNNGGCVEAST